MIVTDFLLDKKFPLWHLPDVIDTATVATGLGLPLSEFSFVEKSNRFGEVTEWAHTQKGFLDQKALAYTFALAAWIRNDAKPTWPGNMRSDVRGAIKKALSYLNKTNDSFFRAETAASGLLDQPQENWLQSAVSGGNSTQIISIRQFKNDEQRTAEQSEILIEKLRSPNRAIVLNAIWAAEKTQNKTPDVVTELRALVDYPDEDVKAKTLTTLVVLDEMDDATVDRTADLLGTGGSYLEFAAAYALASVPTVPDHVLLPMNKGMLRALQGCDYGLVAHFVAAFDRWLDKPEAHFAEVLAGEGPEYMEIVMEAMEHNRNRFVELSEKAG